MSESTSEQAALERRRAKGRAYYQAHKEEMRRKQREYYRRTDKAKHAARVRKYRQENREHVRKVQREYRAKNREHILEMNRRYRAEHRDEQNAMRRAYWYAHRDELLAKKRLYNAAHRGDKRKSRPLSPEQRARKNAANRAYYHRHRYELSRRRLEEECYRSMEQIQGICPERVEEYMGRFPFESFSQGRIKNQLRWWHIPPMHRLYDECWDAGMLAYMYSIHRCALMGYEHVEQYIGKMTRILMICAMNISRGPAELLSMEKLQLAASGQEGCEAPEVLI